MSPEYFAPDFKIELDQAEMAPDLAKYVTQITVVHEPDSPDQLKMTLANPFPTLRWTHGDDAQMFSEGSAVRVEMGYVNDLQLMFDGEITKISPTFPESGTSTVAIEAMSRLYRLKGGSNTRTFQKVNDQQIAKLIADEHKLDLQADETDQVHDYIIQYNQTDMAFLAERAERIQFEMLVEGKKLVFRKARDAESKGYTLVWGSPQKNLDRDRKQMPLLGFNPTMDTLRQVSEVKVRGYDPKTKEKFEGRAGPGDEESKMGGSQTGAEIVSAAFNRREEVVDVETPITSQAEADQLARAIFNNRALELVKGSGSTIGIPDIRAGQVVELLGLGKRFDGDYYLTQTTHTIGSQGYRMNFSVRRSAVS